MPNGRDTIDDKKPSPIDVHVGGRVRLRRNQLGMSQGQLGNILGLTFQQVQKYERGINRMGASRLYDIAKALGVDVPYFYEGIDPITGEFKNPITLSIVAEMQQEGLIGTTPADEKETLKLVRALQALPPEQRKHILGLIKTMGPQTPDKPKNKK